MYSRMSSPAIQTNSAFALSRVGIVPTSFAAMIASSALINRPPERVCRVANDNDRVFIAAGRMSPKVLRARTMGFEDLKGTDRLALAN
jgi:hypothetical protein